MFAFYSQVLVHDFQVETYPKVFKEIRKGGPNFHKPYFRGIVFRNTPGDDSAHW